MKRKNLLLVTLLVVVLLSSFLIIVMVNHSTVKQNSSEFLVGVQAGCGGIADVKALVDRVKNFTNLFVVSSIGITGNEAVLNATCDYIYDAGLKFFIFFLELRGRYPYDPLVWSIKTKEKYGDHFLGAYILDEPGGEVLDQARYIGISRASTYGEASEGFTSYIDEQIGSYFYLSDYFDFLVLTSDYGLYWFDYKAGYDCVLVEYAWNHSRELHTALCRGAANVQNKDWGIMMTHTYRHPPYIESGAELYEDLVTAYTLGAKYAVVFNYAKSDTDNTEFSILTDEHFEAIENFWNYMQNNPENYGTIKGEVALVLPQNYGFGFRTSNDTIWGIDEADHWTRKMWEDVNDFVDEYGFRLDIVFSDPEFNEVVRDYYDEVFFWSSGAETDSSYPVLTLNNSLGYNTIQEAIDSGSTCHGDTIFVKAGTYQENLVISKSINLMGEDKETTILDGGNNGTVVDIVQNMQFVPNMQYIQNVNVNVSGFTIRNSGKDESDAGVRVLSSNTTLSDNIITANHLGIQLVNSINNTLRNNNIFDNEYNFGVHNYISSTFVNDIDASNTVDGKPIIYWVNEHDKTLPSDAGYVALVNCTGITVQNLELTNNYNGLVLANTNKSIISGNVLASNYEGVSLFGSSDNVFRGNTIDNCIHSFWVHEVLANDIDSSNTIDGKPVIYWVNEHDKTVPVDAGYVALINCTGITVQNLNLANEGQGILLSNTTNSIVSQNTITNQYIGIELFASSNNTIAENRITGSDKGIKLENASSNSVINNVLEANENYGCNIISSNFNVLSGNKVTNCNRGILLGNASNNTISGNALTTNNYGIQVYYYWEIYDPYDPEYEIPITSDPYAIEWRTENNIFYHNNFINNTKHVQLSSSSLSENLWDNGVEGNYWDDYQGTDSNDDGIGDTPYIIDPENYYYSNQDNRPLMKPVEIP